jgi:protein PET117
VEDVIRWLSPCISLPIINLDPRQRKAFLLGTNVWMSRASKITLLAVTMATCSTIYFVHKYQADEKAVSTVMAKLTFKTMHEGVLRDAERQRIKRERVMELEEQQRLQKEYERLQPVGRKSGDTK